MKMPKGHYHTDPNYLPNGKRWLCHGEGCKEMIFLSMNEAKDLEEK